MDDPLYIAICDANITKVKHFIQSETNAYAAKNVSYLETALNEGHAEIANYILDIYEKDIKTLESFFKSKNAVIHFWIQEDILVAYGDDHVNRIREMTQELCVTDPEHMYRHGYKGLIIMLIPSSLHTTEVLWLTPKKRGDDIIIAECVQLIYADGVFHLNTDIHCGCSLFDCALAKKLYTVFERMLEMFGHSLLKPIDYVQFFCDRYDGSSSLEEIYETMKLKEFMQEIPDDWSILKIPIEKCKIEIFEFLLDKCSNRRVNEQNMRKSDALSNIVSSGINNYLFICFRYKDESKFPLKCLKWLQNLIDNEEWSQTILAKVFIRYKEPNDEIHHYIIDNLAVIYEKNFLLKALYTLIEHDWVDTVNDICQLFPTALNDFFADMEMDKAILLSRIQPLQVKMIEFLLKTYKEFTAFDIAQLIHLQVNSISDSVDPTQESADLLKLLLVYTDRELLLLEPTYLASFYDAIKLQRYQLFEILLEFNDNVALKGNNLNMFININNITP